VCSTQEVRKVNTGLVGKIEWYGILRIHERIILKTDAKIQCIDCRMNSAGSEYGVVFRTHKHSNEIVRSVNVCFSKYFGDYQLLGKESVARNRYLN